MLWLMLNLISERRIFSILTELNFEYIIKTQIKCLLKLHFSPSMDDVRNSSQKGNQNLPVCEMIERH